MIKINNVYYTYPNGVEALKGISLTIKDSEFVAIMGQNGAGKTTLIKHLNGLLKPTTGKIFVDDTNTLRTSVANLARKIGFVFQNPDNQLFSETVEEEITFGLKNFGFKEDVIKKRVTWALNLLSLTQYRKISPFTLSGGERKRIALASVLAWNPKILVLDEPTIGQDHRQKEKLRQFIMQMRTQNKTIIIVTHDVEFVAECNPRVILMRDGKITADGKAVEILTQTKTLAQASITPPQIAQLFHKLPDNFPKKVIDVFEARKIFFNIWEENK